MILIENFVKRILVKEVLKTIPYFFLSNYLQCQVDIALVFDRMEIYLKKKI